MKTGKLIAFKGEGIDLELKEYPLPAVRAGEILVKNRYTTLCGSDIHTYCGIRKEASPTVLGHEIVGEIVEIGEDHPGVDYDGEPIHPGDLITWSIFSSDPQSKLSLKGMPQKGDKLFKYGHALITEHDSFHGGLAEYCLLRPNTGVLKIPDQMPLPVAAIINCAVATVAGGLRIAGDLKGKNVLIFGMGMLGICCAAMCKEAGASWVGGADIVDKRLEDGLQFGVDGTVNMSKDENSSKVVCDFIQNSIGNKVDVVFDMSGAAEAMEAGLEVLGIGGIAVWIGAVFKNRKLQIDAEKVIRNLHTIRGLHNYNFEDFKYALDFLKANLEKYPFTSIVETEFDLKDAQQAFEYAVKFKPLRVGVRI